MLQEAVAFHWHMCAGQVLGVRMAVVGCRARAYAMTGDYLEADPCCIFQPEGISREAEESPLYS